MERTMPTVDFFGHQISRLIMGCNPFNGGSHVGPELDAEMDAYYTFDNIKRPCATVRNTASTPPSSAATMSCGS